jgi:hypothetical protein
MTATSIVNDLLNEKLFQVIGSTPASIAESLLKVDLKGRSTDGAHLMAVTIFAAAVNKPTLETFLADPKFATIRPILTATLAISGKSNMTAMTLLGHCLMTTKLAGDIVFAAEFRKKMGQDHLWAGELDKGSLSDKQKEILKEKKRVTDAKQAAALGSGFLKHVGILPGPMTPDEAALFKVTTVRSGPNVPVTPAKQTGIPKTPAGMSGSKYASAGEGTRRSPTAAPASPTDVEFTVSSTESVKVPEDVMKYRREVFGQSDADIAESIGRNGLEKFIENTRRMAERDPTGKTAKGGSTAG